MKTKSLISKITRSARRPFLGLMAASLLMVSCGDFFDHESEYVIDANGSHINSASDTIFSVIGILKCVQKLSDRTVLLGEARADLVDITEATGSDLRDVAMFNIGSDNAYNSPRDYYAVINNCNYFIANADTALRNNRNEKIFLKEYAAVKGIRAWTYLQVALNYGRVPFVTVPVLTKEDADKSYPFVGISELCEWLIRDISPLADVELPGYGMIGDLDSRAMFFPINVLLGDLNLWAGHYKEAALCYYNYISKRNGPNSSYPISVNGVRWINTKTWSSIFNIWTSSFGNSYSDNGELITLIPGDSLVSEPGYSNLRNLFNSTSANDWKVSLTPSQAMQDISKAQMYCHAERNNSGYSVIYAPKTLAKYNGDMRLETAWTHIENGAVVGSTGERLDLYQEMVKAQSRNVRVYRRTLVYLRMAEALNRAGYPRFAFQILSNGVNNRVIEDSVIPHYRADSLWLRRFNFPNTEYVINTVDGYNGIISNTNTQGIHSRGSGFTPMNEYYRMPYNDLITDSLEQIKWQQDKVEDLIVDEGALEFAFEGMRFYDLMRVALRRDDPAYLADRVYRRRGDASATALRGLIRADLYNPRSWYLDWNNSIGFLADPEKLK